MKDDCAYQFLLLHLSYTFLFERLVECTFWTWEWKGLHPKSLHRQLKAPISTRSAPSLETWASVAVSWRESSPAWRWSAPSSSRGTTSTTSRSTTGLRSATRTWLPTCHHASGSETTSQLFSVIYCSLDNTPSTCLSHLLLESHRFTADRAQTSV